MSFTADVKDEIALSPFPSDPALLKAELWAFIKLNGAIVLRNGAWVITLKSENNKAIKRLFLLIKTLYQVESHILVTTKVRLKKNHVYVLEIRHQVPMILDDLGLKPMAPWDGQGLELWTVKTEARRTFLMGAFLAAGSINSPTTSNYHLEIAANEEAIAQMVLKVIMKMGLTGKISKRRSHWIVYLKKSEQIADFLRIIFAQKAILMFEEQRIQRDQFISMSRIINCEIANEVKAQEAGQRQGEWVQLIDHHMGIMHLEPKLRWVAELRRDYPEATLQELAQHYVEKTGQTITKSGLNHRFLKLKQIATQLLGGKRDETH